MSGLTLRLKDEPRYRLDLSTVTPERLTGLDVPSMGALPLAYGNHALRLDELFEIEPGDASDLHIRSAGAKLDYVGHSMQHGRITVHGDAGAYVAARLGGGSVRVHGNAGPGAAAGLKGGMLEIDGDAGESLGGALFGDRVGMSGGIVVVQGRAGAYAGERMRRGTILVRGGLDAFSACRMVGGTLLTVAGAGPGCGFGMKRGTVLMLRRPESLPPTFLDSGRHELTFLRLFFKKMGEAAPFLTTVAPTRLHMQRFVGDAANAGKGEILIAAT